MKYQLIASATLAFLVTARLPFATLHAQATAFTYQGRLADAGAPAAGIYDLRFTIYDAASAGTPQGATWTNAATPVSNGLFTVTLDFGNQFPGADRWLAVGVRTNGGGAFSPLEPRQKITATPYAITAGHVTGTVAAGQVTGTLAPAQLPTSVLTNGARNVTLTGAFTGNGGGLTNLPAPPNHPNHANLERLYRWRDTLTHSNRPFRLYLVTDQIDFPFGIAGKFRQLLGQEGGLTAAGNAGGISETVGGTGAYAEPNNLDRPELFLGTSTIFRHLTNGSLVTFNRRADGAQTNVLADRGHVIFLREPMGGTFRIETNRNGAGWGEYATVNAQQAGATNLVATNLTLAYGSYSVRVRGLTGTNRIVAGGGGLWSSTNKMVMPTYQYLNTGPSISNYLGSVNTILPEWFRIMDPDLIIMQDTGPTNAWGPTWAALEAMWSNACPRADIIICGQFFKLRDYPGEVDRDVGTWNRLARESAVTYGRGFFDTAFWVPDKETATNWVTRGLLEPVIGDHFEPSGTALMNHELWNAMGGPPLLYEATVPERNYDGPLGSFLQGRLGNISATTNTDGLFYSGGDAQASIHRVQANHVRLQLGEASAKTQLDGIGDTLLLRGSPIDFRSATAHQRFGTLWPSGGWSFGLDDQVDPGPSNVRVIGSLLVRNDVSAHGVFTGNGGGLTNLPAVATFQGLATNVGTYGTFTNQNPTMTNAFSFLHNGALWLSPGMYAGGLAPGTNSFGGAINWMSHGQSYPDGEGMGGSPRAKIQYLPNWGFGPETNSEVLLITADTVRIENGWGGAYNRSAENMGYICLGNEHMGGEIQITYAPLPEGQPSTNGHSLPFNLIAIGHDAETNRFWTRPGIIGVAIQGGFRHGPHGDYAHEAELWFNTYNEKMLSRYDHDSFPGVTVMKMHTNSLEVLGSGGFIGNGSGLSNLTASQLTGTLPLARLPAAVVTNGATNLTLTGVFSGNGAGLTALSAASLNGALPLNTTLKFTGNRTNGWTNAVGWFENTNPSTNAAPALRVVAAGARTPAGALSVTAQVSATAPNSVLAQFGNAAGFVVTITNDGTIYSKGLALTSDRAAKESFRAVNGQLILEKVAALPVTEWDYKDTPGLRHLGPTAQDFHAAFGLNGADDRHISVVDQGGVALAAIQGLNEKVEAGRQRAEERIQKLEAENAALQARLEKLEQRLAAAPGGD